MDRRPLAIAVSAVVAASAAPVLALPPPPPAPPPADNPRLREGITEALVCFHRKFGTNARFEAEAALKALPRPASEAQWNEARAVVLRYLDSRAAIMACITELELVMQSISPTSNDAEAAGAAFDFMRGNYNGQTPYEQRITRELIERRLAR